MKFHLTVLVKVVCRSNCVSTSVAYKDDILTLKTSTTTSQRAQRVQISG